MHGHGEVVVAPSVRTVVSRCIELELNARILQNILAMGGQPIYLQPAPAANEGQQGGGRAGGFDRGWDAWIQEEKRLMGGR